MSTSPYLRVALLIAAATLVALLLVLLHSTAWLASLGGTLEGERLERAMASPNWSAEETIFLNPVETSVMEPGGTWETTRGWFSKPEDSVPSRELPTNAPDLASPPLSGLRLTWLGHSSTLVEIDGVRVLLDPVFSERASPSTILGPKRFHPLVIQPDKLPTLDAVIISHDHYDHLDMQAVKDLLHFSDALFLVPLGVGAHLDRWGVPDERIVELDWWDEHDIKGLTIAATPSRHFTGRGLFDRFETLWASWTFVGPEHRVFFSGDTGFFDGFKDIAERYGPFDIAMYEIGAYHPAWGQIHLGPEGALDAFKVMDAAIVMPIHWGSFDLGMHSWTEPIETFVSLAEERGHTWVTPAPGASVEPGLHEPRSLWWRPNER
ncbi:MBL fold metallo-hydrolase [Bradymonadaceae bacterium TMQ3]|nr:MBL fold metallo-hydrolase [Bradymonadaceae bacterium TMQ3]TXC77428.1 MBL fold metallo-hydrolase [Bradymonadales bacterium TMQ1]